MSPRHDPGGREDVQAMLASGEARRMTLDEAASSEESNTRFEVEGTPYTIQRVTQIPIDMAIITLKHHWCVLSLPFIPSIAETLEFCITTGYPFRHA